MPSEQQAQARTNDDHFTYFKIKVSGHTNLMKHKPWSYNLKLYLYLQFDLKPTQNQSESVPQSHIKLAQSCTSWLEPANISSTKYI